LFQAIEKAFDQHVGINWDLNIQWGEQLSFLRLANQIEPKIDRIHLLDRVDELANLFRRLFYNSSQVTISRFLAVWKKKVILEVSTFSEEGIVDQFVVACGRREDIQVEEDHYRVFVRHLSDGRDTVRVKSAETLNFAAIVYNLVGGDVEETITLTELYRNGTIKIVTTVLDHLFGIGLAPWYERGRFHEEKETLDELCLARLGLSTEIFSRSELKRQLKSICREALTAGLSEIIYSPQRLNFHLADGSSISCPNPVSFPFETRTTSASPVLCGIIHGLLNGNNVLTDGQERTWLIDFSRTGQGPLVYDFVSLETAIKFDLLTIPNMQARYEMERCLLTVSRLDEEIDASDLEPETQKALQPGAAHFLAEP
jgi:hypothetical protein